MTSTEESPKSDSSLVVLYRELIMRHSGENRNELQSLLSVIQRIEREFAADTKERQRQLSTLAQEVRALLPKSARTSREFIQFANGILNMVTKDHDTVQLREQGRASKLNSQKRSFRY